MPRAAVLGSPITHSLSPVLHRAAFAALKLDGWSYDAFECEEDGLAAFLDGLDEDWAGLSLTMPLKRMALKLADEVSDLALAVGGANTLVLREGRRIADNTDVYGLVTALTEAGMGSPSSALVLGGGATAASALAAVRELGLAKATLAARDPERAQEAVAVGEQLGLKVQVRTLETLQRVLPVDLVISTLPGRTAFPYTAQVAAGVSMLFDVTYSPWPTPLAVALKAAGVPVASGFPMLLHQAARQVELITGRTDVPIEAMRAAGEAAIRDGGV